MTDSSVVEVQVREWHHPSGASWELWWVRGPLKDWSKWDRWGGDSHCVWYRACPSEAWNLVAWMLRHAVPRERQWAFESEPPVIDTTEVAAVTDDKHLLIQSSFQ